MGSKGSSDEELVLAIRAGETELFEVLYDRYEKRLFGYVLRLVKDRDLAEDVFQDIFLTVLRDETFNPARGRFSAWLFRVARNRCVQTARDRSNQSRLLKAEVDQTPDSPEGARLDAVEVRSAMAALTEAQQQLLILKQVGGLSYAEIATTLGIAEGTVKSQLHGATHAFRKKLNQPEERS